VLKVKWGTNELEPLLVLTAVIQLWALAPIVVRSWRPSRRLSVPGVTEALTLFSHSENLAPFGKVVTMVAGSGVWVLDVLVWWVQLATVRQSEKPLLT
jgi:hypothetical protein